MSTNDEKILIDDPEFSIPVTPVMDVDTLWFLPPLLQEIARKGCKFAIGQDGKCAIEGFYKGEITLAPNKDGSLNAADKRGRNTLIRNFNDLVKLNYEWWLASSTKEKYILPPRPWLDYFVEQKMVKKQIIYVPIDEK